MPKQKELYDIKLFVHHQTEKAWKVSETGNDKKAKWVPKSACEVVVTDIPGPGILTIDLHGLERFELEDWV